MSAVFTPLFALQGYLERLPVSALSVSVSPIQSIII